MIKDVNSSVSPIEKSRTLALFYREALFGSLFIVVFALIFLKLSGEIMEKELLPIDLRILQFFYHLRSPLLNTIMIDIAHLGGEIMIGFGIIIVIFLLLKRHWREAALFTFIMGGAGIINTALKNIFQRVRPQFYPLITERDYSFPSGHAMDSFVFYLALSYLLFHVTKNKKLSIAIAILSIFLIGLIGVSRIYLGVHYPSDVLGGYMAGFVWLLGVLLAQKIAYFFNKKTQS